MLARLAQGLAPRWVLLPRHASAALTRRPLSSRVADSDQSASVLDTIEAVLADTATAAAEARSGSAPRGQGVKTKANAPGDFAHCLRIAQALATPGTQWPEAAKRRFAAVLEATGGVGAPSAFVVGQCGEFRDDAPADMRGRPARAIIQTLRVDVAGRECLLFGAHQLDANGHATGNCYSSPTTLETLSNRWHQKAWDKSTKVVWRFTPGPPLPVETFYTWRKHAVELKGPDGGTMVPIIPAHARHHMSEQWWHARVKAAGAELVSLEALGMTNPVSEEARRTRAAKRAATEPASTTRHRRRS